MPPAKEAPAAETFTDEEMDGLSEEERAALDYSEPGDEDDAVQEEGKDAAEAKAVEDDKDPAEPAAADDEAAAEEPKPDAAAQAAAADAGAEEDQAADDQPDPATQPNGLNQLRDDYAKTVEALNEEQAGLAQKVEDGDMTFVEYHKENQRITDAKVDAKSELDDSLNWYRAQSTFFADDANALFRDPVRQTFLQATVNQMAEAGELNGLDYGTAIARAADRVKQAMGVGAAEGAPAPKVEKKPAKPAPKIPQTLGDVPPADDNTIEPNKFAHLDGLEGDDLEAALAKMSTADVDAWLESAG